MITTIPQHHIAFYQYLPPHRNAHPKLCTVQNHVPTIFFHYKEFGFRGSPFPLKIGINLSFLQQPKGPTCFLDFHMIDCTPHPFSLNSSHCTLYFTSINVITFSTFMNFSICSFEIFSQSSTFSPPQFHL